MAQEKPKFRFAPESALSGAQKEQLSALMDAYVEESVPEHERRLKKGIREDLDMEHIKVAALSGGNVVGFAAGREVEFLNQLRVLAIYVAPECRRQGLLGLLMHRMRAEARKRGLSEIRVPSMAEKVARRFRALAEKKGRNEGEFRVRERTGIMKQGGQVRARGAFNLQFRE